MTGCFVFPKSGTSSGSGGAGLLKTGNVLDIVALDNSILINPDDISVKLGNTNGSSLETTATGVELKTNITGSRTFSQAAGETFSIQNTDANAVTIGAQPDGTVPLAIATTDYVDNAASNTTAGAGLTKTGSTIDAVAGDLSLVVNPDDIKVNIGTSNGTTLELSATGLELVNVIKGTRTLQAAVGETITIDTPKNSAVLTATPDGTVPLAIATTDYVDQAVIQPTEVYNEELTVTNGVATVTTANTPIGTTLRVYLSGVRQNPNAGADYSLSGSTITFTQALSSGDSVLVDYKY